MNTMSTIFRFWGEQFILWAQIADMFQNGTFTKSHNPECDEGDFFRGFDDLEEGLRP